MTIREWLKQNAHKHNTRSEVCKACADALDCNPKTVGAMCLKLYGPVRPKAKQVTETNGKPVKRGSLTDFRMQFDDNVIVPQAIEENIAKLVTSQGDPAYMRDAEFREQCGVSVSKWRRYADDYKHLQVRVPGGELFWGHPEIVDEMRKAVQR